MMTITLDLSEEVAAVLRGVPLPERNRYAVAALRRGMGIPSSQKPDADFEEACAAIARSVAQIETGETVSLEDCVARSAAKRAARTPEGGMPSEASSSL